jgi:hypothetical protein
MWLVLSLAGFALAVLLHVFTRMGGSLTIVLSFLGVSIPVAVVIAAVALWMFAISDESVATILVYLALCETYIFLFTLAANGVSVSLMMRLRSRPTTEDELLKSYLNARRNPEGSDAGGKISSPRVLGLGGIVSYLSNGDASFHPVFSS